MEFEGKTILVAPLDWGLGHASRCVPLIRRFAEKNKVIIGTSRFTLPLLSAYFPALETVELPSYNVKYGKHLSPWLTVLLRTPSILKVIKQEKRVTHQYINKYKVDVLVSDNRYGVRHAETINIFICHQVNFQLPFFSRLMTTLHKRWIKHFSEVWIPDYSEPDQRLGGKLTDDINLKIKHRYIGPLSALSHSTEAPRKIKYEYLFLLSGPEPQRSILERKLIEKLRGKIDRVALVRGTSASIPPLSGIDYQRNICSGDELRHLILSSGTVICRSGYSTLMDLHLLGKKDIILIPTPGQPEQEYLAAHWKKSFGTRIIEQRDLDRSVL